MANALRPRSRLKAKAMAKPRAWRPRLKAGIEAEGVKTPSGQIGAESKGNGQGKGFTKTP